MLFSMEMDGKETELVPKDAMTGIEDMNIPEGLSAGLEAMRYVLEPPADRPDVGGPRALEPEIRTDAGGSRGVFVIGDPFGDARTVDFEQGDNPYRASGNCGLVSICNMLRTGGFDVTEDQVTKFAIVNGFCNYDPSGDPSANGGTTAEMRQALLREIGIESDICPSGSTGSLECIADAIDNHQGVVISVNAGLLWDWDDGAAVINGQPVTNHCVTVTGYARDAATGEISGVFIADSGRGETGDACRYLTVEEFDEVYTNAYGSCANITCLPLEGV